MENITIPTRFNNVFILTRLQNDIYSSLHTLLKDNNTRLSFIRFMEYDKKIYDNSFLFVLSYLFTDQTIIDIFKEENLIISFVKTIRSQPDHVIDKKQKDFLYSYASSYMSLVLLSPDTETFCFNIDYSITHTSLGTFHLNVGDIRNIKTFLIGYRSSFINHLEKNPEEMLKVTASILLFLKQQETIYLKTRKKYKDRIINSTLIDGKSLNSILTRNTQSRILFLSYINKGEDVISNFSSRFKPTYCIFLQEKGETTKTKERKFPVFLWAELINDIPNITFEQSVKYNKLSNFIDEVYEIFKSDRSLQTMFIRSNSARDFLLQYLSIKTNNYKEIWEYMKWLRCPSIINKLDYLVKNNPDDITSCTEEDIEFLTNFLFDPYLYYSTM